MEDGHPGGSQATATKDTGPRFGAGSEFDTLPRYGDLTRYENYARSSFSEAEAEAGSVYTHWTPNNSDPRHVSSRRSPALKPGEEPIWMTWPAFWLGGVLWAALFSFLGPLMGLFAILIFGPDTEAFAASPTSTGGPVDHSQDDYGILGAFVLPPMSLLLLGFPNGVAVAVVGVCLKRIAKQWIHVWVFGLTVFAMTCVMFLPLVSMEPFHGLLAVAFGSGLAAAIARLAIAGKLAPTIEVTGAQVRA